MTPLQSQTLHTQRYVAAFIPDNGLAFQRSLFVITNPNATDCNRDLCCHLQADVAIFTTIYAGFRSCHQSILSCYVWPIKKVALDVSSTNAFKSFCVVSLSLAGASALIFSTRPFLISLFTRILHVET